jgi:hypothetical protein
VQLTVVEAIRTRHGANARAGLVSNSSRAGSDDRPMSNGMVVLASRRDLRSGGGRHLARRLDTAAWIVYLFGVRVLVDWGQEPRRLLDDRTSVVGEIEAVDETEDLYRCRMAGGQCALLRSAASPWRLRWEHAERAVSENGRRRHGRDLPNRMARVAMTRTAHRA